MLGSASHAAAFACALLALAPLSCRSDLAGAAPAADDGTTAGAARGLRRLSAREYALVVSDLLGEDVAPSRFPADSYDTGYDNGASALTVQSERVDLYETLAIELASAAVSRHRDRALGDCDPAKSGADACRDAVLSTFATRAFRRPLTTTDLERLRALFDGAAREAGFDAALETTVSAILQSPAFLYREELGDEGDPESSVRLTPYELASELSFLLTGSMPDAQLFAAAAHGALSTPADLRREAARLLDSPRARAQLAHLLDEWLATSRLSITTKDRKAHGSFDAALAQSMRAELDHLFDRVLAGEGTLAELFASNASLVDARLAQHYGLPAVDGAREATLGDERRGVLARAGFLSVHSGYQDSNPIERGVFVRSAILCAVPRPPPPGIPRNVPTDAARTTRERFAAHTANPFCQSCHAAIDGVGFGFEQFDAIGAFRIDENGVRVDPSGDLYDSDGADGPFRGVSDLQARLARSPRVKDCFVRQVFRFAMGRGETDSDTQTLHELGLAFTAHTPIRELLLDLVGRRAFRERWVEQP